MKLHLKLHLNNVAGGMYFLNLKTKHILYLIIDKLVMGMRSQASFGIEYNRMRSQATFGSEYIVSKSAGKILII